MADHYDYRQYITADGDLEIDRQVIDALSEHQLASIIAKAIKSGEIRFPYYCQYSNQGDIVYLMHTHDATRVREVETYADRIPANQPHSQYKYREHFDAEPKSFVCLYDLGNYMQINVLTDLFTESARMQARLRHGQPPIETWRHPENADRTAAACAHYVNLEPDKSITGLTLAGSLFVAGPRMCTNFKINIAEAIYDFFECSIVFDPFAGWGDRALAAIKAPSVRTYYGCDANINLRDGYKQICELGRKYGTDVTLEIVPVEDFLYETAGYPAPTLIFTSPPFYDFEVYVENTDLQSIDKYPRYENWLHQWFLPQFLRQLRFLAPGGKAVYYISNVRGYDIIGAMIDTVAAQMAGEIEFMGGIPNLPSRSDVFRRAVFFYVFAKYPLPTSSPELGPASSP